jgi:hypothetical protein
MGAPLASHHREEAKEKRGARMICVTVEIHEGATTSRGQYTASSIELALALARRGRTDRSVRLLFPIDSEAFFVSEDASVTYQ